MTEARHARMRSAQVAMVFRTMPVGVVSAAVAAIILANAVTWLGATPALKSGAWACVIILCALCHLALKWLYDRASQPSRDNDWRLWGAVFSAICLAEGCGWGWSSISLVGQDRFDLQLMVMLVCCAMAAGSIPTFGSYLPAFWGLFVPTMLPFTLSILFDGRLEQEFVAAMAVLYVAGMAGLGVRSNGELRTILRLGFEKDELTEHLLQEKERAEAANRAKSQFLAAASHDLRQPVHALSLFVGALQTAEMGAEARDLVGHIEASVAALDSLFGALLNISQLDANIVPNRPKPFRVQPLLERICRDHAEEAASKGLSLHLHPCSLSVLADPALLERVLRNLISNAVRYTQRGRVVVGCRRVPGLRGGLRVEVWDTGQGIPVAFQHRVFDEFFQLANPERDRTKGLGLGLAIVRRLVAIMAVDLTVRSVPGRGSLFAVTLPRAADAGRVETPRALPMPAPPTSGGLILVVDDEAAVRSAMQALLLGWGFDVLTAGSGGEMLQRIADCMIQPRLLICDYRLRAGEDGITVIRRLQEEYNHELPAMLITGDTAPERLLEAQRSGLTLLHKPVTAVALAAAISALTEPSAAEWLEDDDPAHATAATSLVSPR
jgi:signal transduction histidine kinase/CheY-like chemotaxis protein